MSNESYNLQARAQQQEVTIGSDGAIATLRMTRAGQLFTADWKSQLVMNGRAFNVTVGGIAAGADVALITGGGNGTTIDSDQPEMIIGTPTGYFHIPLSFTCAVQQDMDADAEESNIILFADLTQTNDASGTSTAETAQNLLDGGPTSVSTCESATTADRTDPSCTVILDYATCQAAQVSAAGTVLAVNRMDFNPDFPMFLKGPCSVVACWGGTSAATGICSYSWAEVPVAWFE